MGKSCENFLNKCTPVLMSPFSDTAMNQLAFYEKGSPVLRNFQTGATTNISLLQGLSTEQMRGCCK